MHCFVPFVEIGALKGFIDYRWFNGVNNKSRSECIFIVEIGGLPFALCSSSGTTK